MSTHRVRAIVFDYDGVLADTESLHLAAFQSALEAHGVPLARDDYFERYLGLDDEGVFKTIAENRGLGWSGEALSALVAQKTRLFREILQCREVLYPGVAERLREWGGSIDLAIASGSIRAEIAPVLEAAGLSSLIRVIVASGETPRSKPFPDPYQRALELLADETASRAPFDSGSCLAVEDSPWGIDSAHAAGLRVVAVATSYDAARLAAADAVVQRFSDLSLSLMDEVVRRPPSPPGDHLFGA